MKKRGLSPIVLALGLFLLMACEREQRQFNVPLPQSGSPEVERTRTEENAWDIGQGKHLFVWFNCVGCHAQGGGGMGPPHMDGQWRYGSDLQSIYTSIMEGRPNGMPAFKALISEHQGWQLAAYVRSMSALLRADVLPGRAESISGGEPELRRDTPQNMREKR